jgi:septin 7
MTRAYPYLPLDVKARVSIHCNGSWSVSDLPEQIFHRTLTSLPFSSGESGLGKSTLINTLFENKLFDPEHRARQAAPPPGTDRGKTVSIDSLSSGMSDN